MFPKVKPTQNIHRDSLINVDLKDMIPEKPEEPISHTDLHGKQQKDPQEHNTIGKIEYPMMSQDRHDHENHYTANQCDPVPFFRLLHPMLCFFHIASHQHTERIRHGHAVELALIRSGKIHGQTEKHTQHQSAPGCRFPVLPKDLERHIGKQVVCEDIEDEPVAVADGDPPDKRQRQFRRIYSIPIQLNNEPIETDGNGKMIPHPEDPFIRHASNIFQSLFLYRPEDPVSGVKQKRRHNQLGEGCAEKRINLRSGAQIHVSAEMCHKHHQHKDAADCACLGYLQIPFIPLSVSEYFDSDQYRYEK